MHEKGLLVHRCKVRLTQHFLASVLLQLAADARCGVYTTYIHPSTHTWQERLCSSRRTGPHRCSTACTQQQGHGQAGVSSAHQQNKHKVEGSSRDRREPLPLCLLKVLLVDMRRASFVLQHHADYKEDKHQF